MNRMPSWTPPFLKALALHGAIIAVLFWRWQSQPEPVVAPLSPAPEVIEATALDEAQVEAELERIKAQEAAARQAEQARQEKLKRQRMAEERRLRELKRKQQKEKKTLQQLAEAKRKKAREEARRLAELKKRQQEEKARLAKLEKARREAEKKRLEEQKKKREEEERKKRLAEEKKRQQEEAKRQAEAEALRQQQLAQQRQRINRQAAEATAKVKQKVERYWLKPASYQSGLSCTIQVRVIPGGEVVEAKVIQSSGDRAFDRSAEVAVRKASPLPIPDDPALFSRFREFKFIFKPEG